MDQLSQGAKRLWKKGFALHHCRPKSKLPVEMKWAKGPRKTWEQLEQSFKPGYNLGVRLGFASRLECGNYLGAIDCDVKSTKKEHLAEMKARLAELGVPHNAPTVLSGRGNGSRHLYVKSPKPVSLKRLAQSSEKVLVMMPSVSPSNFESTTMRPEDLKKGLRLRPAWEICLMGEGQQVVLPDSIHPDSGKRYTWVTDAWTSIPLISKSLAKSAAAASPSQTEKSTAPFTVSDIDLMSDPRIPEDLCDLILSGEGAGDDQSAELYSTCRKLLRAGLSRNEILTVLTDKATWLGECAYRHSKRGGQAGAALWLDKYTLAKVMKREAEVSVEVQFADYEELPPLSEEAAAAQRAEVLESSAKFYIIGKRGSLTPDYESLFQAFKESHPFKTISDMKAVYGFNGTHYENLSPIQIKAFVEDQMSPKPEEKIRTEFFNKVMANHVAMRKFFIDSTENKINFKNGVLDLARDTRGLLPHSPDFGFRTVLPYEYDPDAKCPVFRKWLENVMLGDKALMAVLQEFMGYIVRGGDYKHHKALWLQGEGRNGKSTFIDLLKALIGLGNFSTLSIKSLVGDKFSGSDLDGKIANFSEETSPGELQDSGPFKNLTGDGDISAQKKYGDVYSFRNRAKLVMTYNTMPDLKDLSRGMLSRPIVIPFRKTIREKEQDRSIKEKLFAELPGIFNFALRGWLRLEEQNGFTESEASRLALKQVKEESCNVVQWVENYIEFQEPNFKSDEFKPAREMYRAYKSSERFAYKAPEFGRRLKRHSEIQKRWKRMTDGVRYYGVNFLV